MSTAIMKVKLFIQVLHLLMLVQATIVQDQHCAVLGVQ